MAPLARSYSTSTPQRIPLYHTVEASAKHRPLQGGLSETVQNWSLPHEGAATGYC